MAATGPGLEMGTPVTGGAIPTTGALAAAAVGLAGYILTMAQRSRAGCRCGTCLGFLGVDRTYAFSRLAGNERALGGCSYIGGAGMAAGVQSQGVSRVADDSRPGHAG